jgi:hypothetical protein
MAISDTVEATITPLKDRGARRLSPGAIGRMPKLDVT